MLPAVAVSHCNQNKQSMDRSQETSERTAAPPVETSAEERLIAPAGETAARIAVDGGCEVLELAPPRPLPPLAFRGPADPAPQAVVPPVPLPVPILAPVPMPARIFQRSGPAFEAVAYDRSAPSAEVQGDEQTLPVDAVFSEIDAEAAARSLTAVSGQAPAPPENIYESPPPISKASIEAPPNLGSLIPGAPRFEMPSHRQDAQFGGLQADLAARPSLSEINIGSPATEALGHRSLFRRLLRIAVWLVVGWLAVVLVLMVAYRFINPPGSMLMLQQWLSGQSIETTWVPIEEISPNVVRAVIASEDSRFCDHYGVDFEALAGAVTDVGSGAARGASTISMQVVKNLFLWSSRSYTRKAVELPLTFVMEMLWPKRRIMEVYLNIAEWGPGIFGIEAAAEARFHKPASSLSAGEASRLAVALPNPRVRNPAKPGPGMQRLARIVQMRMRIATSVQTSCVLPRRRN